MDNIMLLSEAKSGGMSGIRKSTKIIYLHFMKLCFISENKGPFGTKISQWVSTVYEQGCNLAAATNATYWRDAINTATFDQQIKSKAIDQFVVENPEYNNCSKKELNEMFDLIYKYFPMENISTMMTDVTILKAFIEATSVLNDQERKIECVRKGDKNFRNVISNKKFYEFVLTTFPRTIWC